MCCSRALVSVCISLSITGVSDFDASLIWSQFYFNLNNISQANTNISDECAIKKFAKKGFHIKALRFLRLLGHLPISDEILSNASTLMALVRD